MLETPGNRCPLCGYLLDADKVVSDDSTPYAAARGCGYWRMMWWTLPAGSYRLGHLARMRQSRASRRFAWWGLLMLSLAGVLVTLPRQGWERIEDRGVSYPSGYPQPAGQGWRLVGRAPRPPALPPGQAVVVRLWWNPSLWAVSLAINFPVTLLLGHMLVSWVIARSNRALRPEYRDDHRFSAAVHYGTAHLPLLLLAALLYAGSLLQDLSHIRQWDVQWPAYLHLVPAFLLTAMGLLLMWFWLLRMAHTTPPETSAAASRYFGLWAPLTVVVVLGSWLLGQRYAVSFVAEQLRLGFGA
jgi:branched-subunit amino acid transport protein